MQQTVAIIPDTRPPLRVRFSALGIVWVREFWDVAEAVRFASGHRVHGKPARVEGSK
jgi:hypothetical protein